MQSAKPIVVPDVSHEPLFLNRASRRRSLEGRAISFVCVPILFGRNAIGALGVELELQQDREYEELVRFLEIVASMTAQAVKADRFAERERRRLLDENTHLRLELKERYELSNLVGNSGPMRQVYEQVAQVAKTNTTVLVRGESGTGKELIAHAIHYNSERAKKPFIKVNCAALPASLIESELFGHEKGAFTGAQGRKKGRFELADGGTLFLDEIGDLDVATQVTLLRVLQEREFERVGGTETVKVNVRLIAATNKDLEQAIEDRTFREDLYYRLNVFSIFVPALRERKTDIMLLADFFLSKYAREHRKSIKRISTPAIDMLVSYHWPGQRARAGEHDRACRARVRRQRDPRPPSAADAADRRGVGHGGRRHARRRGGEAGEGSHPGRAQDGARQPRACRTPARQHRARDQLQDPKVRGGLRALPALRARALRPLPPQSMTYVARDATSAADAHIADGAPPRNQTRALQRRDQEALMIDAVDLTERIVRCRTVSIAMMLSTAVAVGADAQQTETGGSAGQRSTGNPCPPMQVSPSTSSTTASASGTATTGPSGAASHDWRDQRNADHDRWNPDRRGHDSGSGSGHDSEQHVHQP